jgi:hypothetical protein
LITAGVGWPLLAPFGSLFWIDEAQNTSEKTNGLLRTETHRIDAAPALIFSRNLASAVEALGCPRN